MLHSSIRIFAVFIALAFGAISLATQAEADRKKRGYSVHAGKSVGQRQFFVKQVRKKRGQRRAGNRYGRRDGRYGHRRGYGNRNGYQRRHYGRNTFDRGYNVLAGRDFGQSREVHVTIENNASAAPDEEPIVIEPLQHIPKIIKMTEHQKHLGHLRANRRGDSSAGGEAGITVLSEEPQGGLSGGWNERIEKDDFGDETIVYFQD